MQTTAHEQSVLVSPPAIRLRRPGWRDPRLLLGVVLVAGSVALGSWLVSAAGRTTPVFVTRGPLVAGEAIEASGLQVRDVRLPEGPDLYLTAKEGPPPGLVATRTVGAGEIVPLSAVARSADLDVRPVAVAADGPLSTDVVEGSVVDLWFVPEPARGAEAAAVEVATTEATVDGAAPSTVAPGAPRQLAAALTVSEVSTPEGALAVGATATVHVLVPVGELAQVLQALSAAGSVEVVHVPGSAPRP